MQTDRCLCRLNFKAVIGVVGVFDPAAAGLSEIRFGKKEKGDKILRKLLNFQNLQTTLL